MVFKGTIVLGMNKAMVTDVIGKPDVVNRTVSANGTSEQWIYRFSYSKDEYYYFENGKLTTWQD